MSLKTLSLLAVLAAVSSLTIPAFADENDLTAPNVEQMEMTNPDASRPPMRNFTCFASNMAAFFLPAI